MYKNKSLEILPTQRRVIQIQERQSHLLTTRLDMIKMERKHKKNQIQIKQKKYKTSKNDSVTEIQVNDLDTSTKTEDNDSYGWRHLPEISSTSEESELGEADEPE